MDRSSGFADFISLLIISGLAYALLKGLELIFG